VTGHCRSFLRDVKFLMDDGTTSLIPESDHSLLPINSNDIFSIDWGERGGPCYNCFWGSDDCLRRCLCFCCCPWCTNAKLLAWTLGQECSIVNHFIPACFCDSIFTIPCASVSCLDVLLQHNVRRRLVVGSQSSRSWIGDFLLVMFCGCCSRCQMTRPLPREAWDWYEYLDRIQCYQDPCMFTLPRYDPTRGVALVPNSSDTPVDDE